MARKTTQRSAARGMSLLEAVISLSVLLIGILGMLQLSIFSSTSDEAGRAHTQAVQVAHELLAGLQQLAPEDPLLDEQFTGTTVPSEFGHLVSGDAVTATSYAAWSDSLPVAGVTLDSELLASGALDPVDPTLPRFQRRWTVWMPTTPITADSSKLIAVSVTWRERGVQRLREVVLYGSVINAAAVTAYANFYR